jgi:hypothetical protein
VTSVQSYETNALCPNAGHGPFNLRGKPPGH